MFVYFKRFYSSRAGTGLRWWKGHKGKGEERGGGQKEKRQTELHLGARVCILKKHPNLPPIHSGSTRVRMGWKILFYSAEISFYKHCLSENQMKLTLFRKKNDN